jgi:hypothetical protein
MTVIATMRFSKIRSFLISRRIGSGRAFLPSKEHARFHTVPRFWEERLCQLILIPIAFGCFYRGMPKLLFRRQLSAAGNLTTPATDAATSTTNVAAIAASVMSSFTTSATGSVPTAAVAASDTATSAVTPSAALDDFAFPHPSVADYFS